MNSVKEALLRCSFCGKTQEEVKKIIAGPTVYICDECIGACIAMAIRYVNRDGKVSAKHVDMTQVKCLVRVKHQRKDAGPVTVVNRSSPRVTAGVRETTATIRLDSLINSLVDTRNDARDHVRHAGSRSNGVR